MYMYMQTLYKTIHYKTVLNIRQSKGGPQKCCNKQKCIDYIEK